MDHRLKNTVPKTWSQSKACCAKHFQTPEVTSHLKGFATNRWDGEKRHREWEALRRSSTCLGPYGSLAEPVLTLLGVKKAHFHPGVGQQLNWRKVDEIHQAEAALWVSGDFHLSLSNPSRFHTLMPGTDHTCHIHLKSLLCLLGSPVNHFHFSSPSGTTSDNAASHGHYQSTALL